ncbi:hypothetical protein LB534_14835 [Mesorhizobium sp. CA18]|uniref:hypothetical protein n=1 Tax=unclassified Mesorhizobium TaxID=325217 RepID=UPI001CCD2B9B|nr:MULTISPECIES: hypothetical protein [unclassified Mesorhizobium]MBZ9737167.1 hypothetical protein [Mesorhizobium sp. CA9]MBZ9826561.1 hypothetical protein [Mesorhizobium sp. CA18]MBZ9830788.1 hypothetical protein [Mesorhizobium sp. CA2]MBZ9835536.1 hypothetical protein [Mesorhizobium sp. CA3]MBZ9875780.1 hypothetical protein [Mesorhizobium sp. Ca11]
MKPIFSAASKASQAANWLLLSIDSPEADGREQLARTLTKLAAACAYVMLSPPFAGAAAERCVTNSDAL